MSGCQRPSVTGELDKSHTNSNHIATHVETAPANIFARLTGKVGVDFIHQVSNENPYFMPRSVGSGAAILDFDGDGRMDLYLLQNAGADSGVKNQLYHQASDGSFHNVSDGSGLDVDGLGMGVATGDLNNDAVHVLKRTITDTGDGVSPGYAVAVQRRL